MSSEEGGAKNSGDSGVSRKKLSQVSSQSVHVQ